MLVNNIKNKIKKNELTIGSWITLPNIIIPELLSYAKFDWLCIDMEHTPINLNDVQNLIISIENNNLTSLVRVGDHDSNNIKRIMDIGADGIIAANVKNKNEAMNIVNSVKYPSQGKRGVGLYRAQKYGYSLGQYMKWLEKKSIVIVQIESLEAIENLEEIFSTKGVDAFMIGPYDLSASLGIPGDFNNLKFKKSIKKIMSMSIKYNLTAGIHSVSSSPDEVINKIKQGFNFISYSLDTIFLADSALNGMQKIKDKIKNK